jgi:hypothetical protein
MRFSLCLAFVIVLPLAGEDRGTLALAQRDGGNDRKAAGNPARNNPARKTERSRDAQQAATSARRDAAAKSPMALTPAREAAAVTFAKVNHAELADLLERLKERNKPAYRRALRQLYEDSERLARVKERMPRDRYELAMNAWKIDSRIRLLTARIETLSKPDVELETQLKDALLERVDLRIRQIEFDRDRLLQRIHKMDSTVSELKSDREKAAEQHLQRVKRTLGIKKKRPNRKPQNRKNNEDSRTNPRNDAETPK